MRAIVEGVPVLEWTPAGGYVGMYAETAEQIAETLGPVVLVEIPNGYYPADSEIVAAFVIDTVLEMFGRLESATRVDYPVRPTPPPGVVF